MRGRRARVRCGAASILLVGGWALSLRAEPSQQVPVGPRAVSMGSAFSSIADDATAIFWNPAGLAFIGHQEFTATYANLFGVDIEDNFLAYVLPLSRRQAVGVDWYHSGFSDPELDFSEDRFDLSYSLRFGSLFSVGANAKYLRRGVDLDGVEVVQGTGAGYGLDLGVLLEPYAGLRFALVGQDVFDTEIESSDGASSVVFPRNVRGAVSYAFGRRGTVALDVDDRTHLGGEYRPFEALALRVGVEDDRQSGEGATFAAGMGVKLGFLRFDYAYVDHPVLDSTNHFGLSLAFNFNPAEIRIEKVEVQEIYASLHKSYAQMPIGTVVLRNLRDRPLETRLSVNVRELMDVPSEVNVILRPKATQEFPLTALLSEKCMAQKGDRPVQVAVSATYQSHLLLRTEKSTGRGVAYGPGAIDWGRGVAQAAAFVTTRDPAVEALARQASHSLSTGDQVAFASRNIAYAAVLMEALATIGVVYVQDPNNPYGAMSQTPHAVDTVHYPRETLEKKAGDCDDTTVLMAALLGNVGVPTRFIDVPQHLFLLVGTDVHERHRAALALDEELYVVSDDEVWIPLETTAIGRGFAAAWREGAERYRDYTARGKLVVVDVAASQSQYPPAQPLTDTVGIAALDTAAVQQRLAQAAREVAGWREEYMAAHFGQVRGNLEISAQALCELAYVYFLAGQLDEARTKLTEAESREPRSAALLNNRGILDVAAGDLPAALQRFASALELDRDDPGIWLNLGVARYAAGDSLGAGDALRQGVEKSGGYAEACRLLGLPAAAEAERAGTQKLSSEEARALLVAALRQVPAPGDSVAVLPAPNAPPTQPARPPARTRVGASRSGDEALERYLYWKEPGGVR